MAKEIDIIAEELAEARLEIGTLRSENVRLTDTNQLLRNEIQELKSLKTPKQSVVLPPPGAFTFSGRVGGQFSIDGRGFGLDPATIRIDDREVVPTRWKDTSIKGTVPTDLVPDTLHSVTVNGTTLKFKF